MSSRSSRGDGRARAALSVARLGGLSAAAVLASAVAAGPASAQVLAGSVGDAYSPSSLSLPLALALFLGLPALGFLIAAVLSFRPQRDRGRYRPGRPWDYETQWFGQPPERSDERRRMALPHAGGASGDW